jgi:hypothetical protein
MLLAVKFDDQLLVDITLDVLSGGQCGDRYTQVFTCRSDPARATAAGRCLPSTFNVSVLVALVLDRDRVADLDLE